MRKYISERGESARQMLISRTMSVRITPETASGFSLPDTNLKNQGERANRTILVKSRLAPIERWIPTSHAGVPLTTITRLWAAHLQSEDHHGILPATGVATAVDEVFEGSWEVSL